MDAYTRHNLLVPIGHLPTEILGIIFRLFVASCGPLTDIDALFLLSRVCSRWRIICNNTPLLWTRPCFHRCNAPWLNREIMSSILSRSGVLPLSVTIDMIRPRGFAPDAVLDYQSLLEVRDRLEHLVLSVHFGDVLPCIKRRTFPRLVSLDITMTSDTPHLADFFRSCPSLRTFSLTVSDARFCPIPALPFHQLTSLTLLLSMLDTELYGILIKCTLLEECRIGEVRETGRILTPRNPVHIMPALRSLDYAATGGDLLRRLRFPLLESLTLSSESESSRGPSPWNPTPIILELHDGDGAVVQLQSLTLSGLDINTEQLGQLLRRVGPTLQTLVFVDMPAHVSPASLFTADLPLPRLATLEICGNSDDFDGVAVMKVVDSLWAEHRGGGDAQPVFPALRVVQLDLDGALFDEAVEERLARVEEESNGFFRDLGVRSGEREEEEEMSDFIEFEG